MNWIPVCEASHLETIVSASFQKPQLVFKHSTRCGISAYALERIENGEKLLAGKIDCHYLDLLKHRAISIMIADEWNVPHQSPQVILLKDGKPIYTASHSAIQPEKLITAIS